MVILAMLLACRGEPAPLPPGDPSRPDIVLVSIDTLRADHLSCYGHDRPTSPFIDRLAEAGTRFAQARSPSPWTLPAHTTLMSGQLVATHRVIDDAYSLSPDTPVLAESLRAGGYRTGGFVSTLYVSSLFGFQRGFDRFEDFGIHSEKQNLSGSLTFDRVIDEALDWWRTQPAGQPVFLFLHTYDVHYEYDPPEPYASMFDRAPRRGDPHYKNYFYFKKHPLTAEQLEHQRAQYDEAIRWVDDQLARLDEHLAASGRRVRWVVTADHGEEFGERGSWGHAHTLYAEQLHIPLVIAERGGDSLPAGKVVVDPVGLQDVAPTIAGWVEKAAPLQPDGIDLSPVMGGQPAPTRAFTAQTSRFETNRVGLFADGLRLEWDLKANRVELFDLDDDPTESRDLSRRRPADVARLQRALVEALGSPWRARRAGTVSSRKSGRVLTVDDRGVRAGVRSAVTAGQAFQVLPYDAPLWFSGKDGAGAGGVQGPWKALGGALPGADAPVEYQPSLGGPRDVALDDATREALEALGYMQEEPGP